MSQLLSVNVGLPRDIELLTFGGWPLLAQTGRSRKRCRSKVPKSSGLAFLASIGFKRDDS
jgi:hypothetical protein